MTKARKQISSSLTWPHSFQSAITGTRSKPQLPQTSSYTPLVLIEASNDFVEGSHFLPTVGNGTSYRIAPATMFLEP